MACFRLMHFKLLDYNYAFMYTLLNVGGGENETYFKNFLPTTINLY